MRIVHEIKRFFTCIEQQEYSHSQIALTLRIEKHISSEVAFMLQTVEVSAEAIEVPEVSAQQEVSEDQKRLVVLAEDTRMRVKRGILDIYHIGANLLEAQSILVGNGEFLAWIATEFDMGKSSAYRFMDVARAFQDNLPNLGNFEIAASTLYQLASPSIPDSAREEVVELAEAGEVVTTTKAREIIEKHSPAISRKSGANKGSAHRDTLPPSPTVNDSYSRVGAAASSSLESDRTGAEAPETTEQPATTHGLIPGVIARVTAKNREWYGEKVQVVLFMPYPAENEVIVFCRKLDDRNPETLQPFLLRDLELLPQLSHSQLLGRIIEVLGVSETLASDVIAKICDHKQTAALLQMKLDEETLEALEVVTGSCA